MDGIAHSVHPLCHYLLYNGDLCLDAFTKNKETLRAVSAPEWQRLAADDSPSWGILWAICAYHDQYKTLCKPSGLLDFAMSTEDHTIMAWRETMRAALDDIKSTDEDLLRSCKDPAVLIDRTIKEAKQSALAAIAEQGAMISTLGPTKKRGKYKDPSGVADACAFIVSAVQRVRDAGAADDEDYDPLEINMSDNGDRAMMVNFGDVTLQKFNWVWPNKIPQGKITLGSGQQDVGKTSVAIDIIARVTTGRDWPDGEKNMMGPREVVFAFTEDDEGDTILPRLLAAGADIKKVWGFRSFTSGKDGKKRHLQLKDDCKALREMLSTHPNVALLVMDPMTGFMGDVNMNKDQEVRPVLEALKKTMGKCGTTFIGLQHVTKRGDVDAKGKVQGGSSVLGVTRACWDFSADPDNEGEYFMSLVKNNNSTKKSGMKYKLVSEMVRMPDGSEQSVGRVEWIGECTERADDILKKAREKSKVGGDLKQMQCNLLIKTQLEKTGRCYAADVYALGEKEGLSTSTLWRAAKALGLKTDGKDGKRSVWIDPEFRHPCERQMVAEEEVPDVGG
jgi:putative DNA primase/helicase